MLNTKMSIIYIVHRTRQLESLTIAILLYYFLYQLEVVFGIMMIKVLEKKPISKEVTKFLHGCCIHSLPQLSMDETLVGFY